MITRDHETSTDDDDVDVIVGGAGMAGLYLLYRLRALGFSARAFEAAGDVGGTWYWNRYPGARCDVESVDYSFSFDPALDREWSWSERHATQPEILRYLQFVADKYDLRRDIEFETRVERAEWDDAASCWRIHTDRGANISGRFYVMATGCLSVPKTLDIDGVERFEGDTYWTSSWPHTGVDFTGKRVAVIGTGSSGIQSIPIIAEQAERLTVFQRTANFSIPARNDRLPHDKVAARLADPSAYREAQRRSRGGVSLPDADGALEVSDDERRRRYEAMWDGGGLFPTLGTFKDLTTNPVSNSTIADFVRGKIREIVDDPDTADVLCPTDHPFATKRPCVDTGYYETYNRANVDLVDLRATPITTITEAGVETEGASYEFDAIVFATGFDAMTGALVGVDITGRDGASLRDKWADGPTTYLGLAVAGFPNLFTITGPGSPSVLSNMVVSIEQHVDWVTDAMARMRADDLTVIEATPAAEQGWVRHVDDFAAVTLFPLADSWYMGANVPGKPRMFLPYVGGVGRYRDICDAVVADDYLGFAFDGPAGRRVHDGVVIRLQPDVMVMLETMAALGLPSMDSMSPDEARAFNKAVGAQRAPGPEVGSVTDGMLPGADGDIEFRCYRPASPGPHPIVSYFHGGGWVIGDHTTDDPFCRDLCANADVVVVSVNYRHAPEHRFPAAADDAYAAVQWIAANAAAFDADADQLAVAGWSAGGNIAAVACQRARDAGGPTIRGQLLVTPATDGSRRWGSYDDNADGYVLTDALMQWFWNHYADPGDRSNPLASPGLGDLSDLPPAVIATAEFDPLRDEGTAYAQALAAAGNQVRHIPCRGQIHTSLTATNTFPSSARIRADLTAALREFFT